MLEAIPLCWRQCFYAGGNALKTEKTTAESATAFLLLLYQIAMYVLLPVAAGRRSSFRPVPCAAVCCEGFVFSASSVILCTLFYLSLFVIRLQSFLETFFLAASCIYGSFYLLYLCHFALSLSFCLETFVCGLLLSCSRPRCRVILNLYLVPIPLRGEVFYLNLFPIPSLSTIFLYL